MNLSDKLHDVVYVSKRPHSFIKLFLKYKKKYENKRIGRLLITSVFVEGSIYCKCICDCGNTVNVLPNRFERKCQKSCGCLLREYKAKGGERSGALIKTAEYRCWTSMKTRCLNQNCEKYKNYGGRGIKICKRWNNYFNFLADMGRRPSNKHSIDRINNNGDYKPSNCRWVLQSVQIRNRRCSVYHAHKGIKMTLREWERFLGFTGGTLRKMLVKRSFAECYKYYSEKKVPQISLDVYYKNILHPDKQTYLDNLTL